MRIAHVNQDPGIAPGRKKGAAVHVEAMRAAFARLGAEVVALDVRDDGALVHELGSNLGNGGVDLVYERYALQRHASSAFAHANGIAHVLEVNAPLADEEARWRGNAAHVVDTSRERAMFGRAARVLAVSSAVADYCVALGAVPERVVVTPNAVDPDLFRPRAVDDELHARLVPAGRVVIGFHGRLRPWHNFPMLVDALELLIGEDAPVHLLVLGEGEFERDLHGRVPEERITRLEWMRHDEGALVVACTDILPLTYAADEACYFSPLKLLEGMAVGAVPVVPAIGDLERAVLHGHDGLVYRAGDLDGLVRALRTLVFDPVQRARLGCAARARAERHSWTNIARSVLNLVPAGRLV